MADYFLVLDAETFEGRMRPALAECWKRRSFVPCQRLCATLVPSAHSYAERYHLGSDEPLLTRVAEGLPFDRSCWRHLVGEMLLFAALEIPEMQTCPDTLRCLLAAELPGAAAVERAQRSPIEQAHHGSRDLTFGSAVYRPEHAGYNNAADVARLADYLEGVRPEEWTVAALHNLPDAGDEDDRAEELAFAQEWFPVLGDLYRRARLHDCVLVHESIF